MEARKQGAESQTCQPMLETEFQRLHEVFKSYDQAQNASIWKYGMPALINLQFHFLIARMINNVTQVVVEHIRVHDNFPNALKTRLNWSKNVQDECNAPWQVFLGSMNAAFCVFVSLGFLLEVNLKSNPSAFASPYVFSFSDDVTVPAGGRKAKDIAQTILEKEYLNVRSFNRQVYQEATQFGSLPQHMSANAEFLKTTKTFEDDGKEGVAFLMFTTM